MTISSSKLTADLKKALDEKLATALKGVKKSDLDGMGQIVVKEMKDLIAKGISPIEGAGRFSAYIKANEGGYPLTARKKYPGKKPRPVNLRLSGDFLDDGLDYRSNVGKLTVEVGYFDKENINKETGHRDGVHGQPKRPTIPKGNETFAQSIIRKLESQVQALMNRLKA